MAIRPGDHLEPLGLASQDGGEVKVPSGSAWTLLYWYPKADTPGCVAQAESLRDNFEAFEALDCRILGASFDAVEINRAFRDKYRLPFSLLSDPTGRIARALGVAREGDDIAQRVAFLVGADGSVVERYDVADPTMFGEMVLADLESVVDHREPRS